MQIRLIILNPKIYSEENLSLNHFIVVIIAVNKSIFVISFPQLSLQRFLTTFAETATSIVELRSFINNVCRGYNNGHERIPQTFQAFGFAILKYLQVRNLFFFCVA